MPTSQSKKLCWGILGTARINEKILPHLIASRRSEVGALGSRSLEKAKAMADEWKVPNAYGSYEAVISDPNVDAIYISLPNHLHYSWAKAALSAGKHVLVEKPLALRSGEAEELSALARDKGVHLSEGFMYRHHEQSITLLELIHRGELGAIRRIQGSFHITLPEGPNIRTNTHTGGGAAWDVGCYLVNFANALMGRPPTSVYGVGLFENSYDDALSGILDYGNGVTALIDFGFRGPRLDEMQIVCEKGWIEIPHPFKPSTREGIRILRKAKKETPLLEEIHEIVDDHDAYHSEVMEFENAIFEKRTSRLAGWESAAGVRTLEALLESARSKHPVILA
ncbi:MAG: Gfo/Idh/MocA family oxidoreductase [Cryobacterium sp.]|nr:Gfo/Idh/MocA family oxidoreductase [Oligoflexia bacterium]